MNMKELKTLKDMEHYNSWEGFKGHIEERELKAEAVKWVKHYEKLEYTEEESQVNCEHEIQWIMYFFNLTEEDLK